MHLPTYESMMNPLIDALHNLGGSGTIQEIDNEVADILQLTDEQLEVLHNPEKSSRTEVEYRLAWTRTYLKSFGLIDNSSRGVWAFTPDGRNIERIDPREVVQFVRDKNNAQKQTISTTEASEFEEVGETSPWRDELINILLQMEPSAFERLFQRILREAGFTQVEVTGGSSDGGIDGTGILRIGGFVSFQILFQCKRWKSSVGSAVIRDFRGAMQGRADKGLIVTTSTFTQEAIREATRDGAPTIDLIDGDQLVDKLKELGLGVNTREIVEEVVSINIDWFSRM